MRGSILEYNKYIKNTLSDLTNMFEFAFKEDITDNYRTYSLLKYNELSYTNIDVINLPNYIDAKISEYVGDLKNFFSFQNDSYIFNYKSEKDTIALRGDTLIMNYNYRDETDNVYFRNIIQGELINTKLNKYSAIVIDVDFDDMYTIQYDGIANNVIYSESEIVVEDLYSVSESKSKIYELYSLNKGDKIPKYRINGAILSVPSGILFSSTYSTYNIRKNGSSLEINSGGNIDITSQLNINMTADSLVSITCDSFEVESSNIVLGSCIEIDADDITLTINGSTGTLDLDNENYLILT